MIYQIENDISKAVSLEDIFSDDELQKMLKTRRIRLWRFGNNWVTLTGGDFDKWNQLAGEIPGLYCPHIIVYVEALDVKVEHSQ